MAVKTTAPDGSDATVKAPGQLVISAYVGMSDITCKVTPDIKAVGDNLLFIDLANGQTRLGGSALAQVHGQVGNDCPDVWDVNLLKRAFEAVQELVSQGQVLSVHDRSDGGLITNILEMAFAGNCGVSLSLPRGADPISYLFNEELGLVIECSDLEKVTRFLVEREVPYLQLGRSVQNEITIESDGEIILLDQMVNLRRIWEETSTALDRLQANPECVEAEAEVNYSLMTPPPYSLSFEPTPTSNSVRQAVDRPKVAVLREQGSNGDREMAAAFYLAGFEPWDVTMTDLVEGRITLDLFKGIAFVGGFSFADVLDAGKGWAGVIRFNEQVAEQFRCFNERTDTFSLGVCNGCQLLAPLGWVPGLKLDETIQPRFIRNRSERFESRFATVQVIPSPAIMLRGMADSILGVWAAHGEGRFHDPGGNLSQIEQRNLVALRFVDADGRLTEQYPFNPNGSPQGITALCSPDGRHLAMMPHPERTFMKWQWPWMPAEWQTGLAASPWLRLFQNAYHWCAE